MDKQTKKLKKRLHDELKNYLDLYKEVSTRGEDIKEFFDREIERIIEALKKIGK